MKTLRNLALALSLAGLMISLSLHLILLAAEHRFPAVEAPLYIVSAVFFLSVFLLAGADSNLRALYWAIPLWGRIQIGLLAAYGLGWYLTGPFGALKDLPAEARLVAEFHQAACLQTLIALGFLVSALFWLGKKIK